jgi:hypothetical protein
MTYLVAVLVAVKASPAPQSLGGVSGLNLSSIANLTGISNITGITTAPGPVATGPNVNSEHSYLASLTSDLPRIARQYLPQHALPCV